MRSLPVGVATALGTVKSMAATLFSVIFFGDKLAVFSAIGIVLIRSALVTVGLADDGNARYLKNTGYQLKGFLKNENKGYWLDLLRRRGLR